VANPGKQDVHAFSVELNSKRYLTVMKLGERNGVGGSSVAKILLEGSLGRLLKMGMVEDSMLEIKGSRGILRLDIERKDIRHLLEELPD
jgi:Fe2+ transport system protein FeoA